MLAPEQLVVVVCLVSLERIEERLAPLLACLLIGPLCWLTRTPIVLPLYGAFTIPFVEAHVAHLFGAVLVGA